MESGNKVYSHDQQQVDVDSVKKQTKQEKTKEINSKNLPSTQLCTYSVAEFAKRCGFLFTNFNFTVSVKNSLLNTIENRIGVFYS